MQTEGRARLPRVIVLDDHADTLALLGRLLSTLPVDAIPTASCGAALEAARVAGGVEILITDLHLGDGDGLALARELRQAHRCAVIVTSGDPPPTDGLPAGVDVWLSKPLWLADLRRAVEALCRR